MKFKNKNSGFSLTELIIATIFMGAIMALILPTIGLNIIAKERITAYNLAFKKVYEAASEAGIVPPPTESQAQILWGTLNKNLPIIGYVDKSCNSDTRIGKSNCKLRKGARWHKDSYEKDSDGNYLRDADGNKIVSKSKYNILGDPSDMVDNETGQSPWLVSENGLSFAVNTTDKEYGCQNSSVLYNLKVNDKRHNGSVENYYYEYYSCADVFIDVNGPNKGPNQFCDMSMTEKEMMKNLRKCDRFHAYVTFDGVSAGPYDQNTKKAYIEHWMHERK